MASNAAPNVWSQMNYVPPRGQCNFKASYLGPKCPCLRFMLHPLKSSSSYECDGCTHHASFHSMENKAEDEIRKRWESEAREKIQQEERTIARPRKRLRELEFTEADASASNSTRLLENGALTPDEMSDAVSGISNLSRGKKKATRGRSTRKAGPGTTRAAAARTKGRVMGEVLGEDTIELD